MGTVDLWALPEDKADENLVSLFLRVEVGHLFQEQLIHQKLVLDRQILHLCRMSP